MNIIPRFVPSGLDVMKDDLSHFDPDTKVPISTRISTGLTHPQERCEELKIIMDVVKRLQEKENGRRLACLSGKTKSVKTRLDHDNKIRY
jgi:hypothetical protein